MQEQHPQPHMHLQDSMQMDGIAVDESQLKKISSDQTGLPACLHPPKRLCIAVKYSAALAAALVVMYAMAFVASNNAQWVQTDHGRLEDNNGHGVSTGVTLYSAALTPSQILAMGMEKASHLQSITLYDDDGVIHTHQIVGAVGPASDGSFVLLIGAETGIRIADGSRGVEWAYVRVEHGVVVVVPEVTLSTRRGRLGTMKPSIGNRRGHASCRTSNQP